MAHFLKKSMTNLPWLRLLILIVLLIGVFFRLFNLDGKIYSFDETYTSLRSSGYTNTELLREVTNSGIVRIGELQKYQRPAPEKNDIGTVKGLAEEEPQHPPLYFLLARFWRQCFGNSVAVTRSLSALISLLVFPAIYWLCLELFKSPLAGWMAILLVAISPFHVLYAQEAREYSLWTVMILLSSTLLLRAIRQNTKLSWSMYAVGLAAGLYTFPFTAFVALGHGIYVAFVESFRLTKTVIYYLLASLVGFLSFLPWLFVIVSNLSQIEKTMPWADEKVGWRNLLRGWTFALSSVFYDTNIDWQYLCDTHRWQYLPIFLLLPLIGYSIYFLLRYAPKPVWLFILLLIGITAIALVLPDLIFGGRRSLMARYLIPSYLGIELAVAYLFATQIGAFSVKAQYKKLWQYALAILLSTGVLSCAISSQAETWWNKYNDPIHKVAKIINQTDHPLLVTDGDSIGIVMALSYRVKPETKVQVFIPPSNFKLSNKVDNRISNVFVIGSLGTLKEFKNQLKTDYKYSIKQIDASWCIPIWGGFWKVEKSE